MATEVFSHLYKDYVLVILLSVYISAQWCRYLRNDETISIVASTRITLTQYAFLAGYAFSFFYIVCGLFMGRAADWYNRKNIIFFGLLIWNLAIVVMGLASGYDTLLMSRVMLGIGASFSTPASYSLIADYFAANELGHANGVFGLGYYIGSGLSSLSITMAKSIGWREACFTIAGIGFFLALILVFTVGEPDRKESLSNVTAQRKIDENDSETSLWSSLKQIFDNKLVVVIIIAGSVQFTAGYAISGYMSVYFIREFPDYSTEYSYINAVVIAIGGALSSYGGGRISDAWYRSGFKHASLFVPIIGSLLAIPFIIITLLSSSFYIAIISLFFEYLFAECWYSPIISVLQNSLHPRLRGTGIATFTFVATMSGSLATSAIGWFYDYFGNDISSLKWILLVSICTSYGMTAIIFWIATFFNTLEGDYAKNCDEETTPLMVDDESGAEDESGKLKKKEEDEEETALCLTKCLKLY